VVGCANRQLTRSLSPHPEERSFISMEMDERVSKDEGIVALPILRDGPSMSAVADMDTLNWPNRARPIGWPPLRMRLCAPHDPSMKCGERLSADDRDHRQADRIGAGNR